MRGIALSRQILELVKTRGEITVKEIEESTGANRDTIKVHVKKLAEQQYLHQVGQGRGARYMIKQDRFGIPHLASARFKSYLTFCLFGRQFT